MSQIPLCALIATTLIAGARVGFAQTVFVDQSVSEPIPESPALREFLRRFDPISERGFLPTMRSGSTGIGYTLESLLQIRENNSPRGDLLGMEIKAYRDDEEQFDDSEKMNLFLKEPEWLDGKSSADRVRDYGYIDPNGRRAWYQSVTCHSNSGGLKLAIDQKQKMVILLRRNTAIGQWAFNTLRKRLTEKLSEVVFVAADCRGHGPAEKFRYRTVTYCANPSLEALLDLIADGDVILELRMHVKDTGGVRNHGTAFRLRKHRLRELYAIQRRCRPIDTVLPRDQSSH